MDRATKIITADGFVTERVDVHQNGLLGDYDQEGKYYINDKIIAELLQMRKTKKSTYNNSMFCVSNNLGIGELVFEVHYNKKVVNGIASAEMFLLENVYKVNGYYSNTIRTKIGEFKESVSGFIDKSYTHFNISLVDEDDGREEVVNIEDLPYPYILSKRQYENTIFMNMEESIYEAYEEYFQTKMEIMKEQKTPFADAIISEYEKDLKEIENKFINTGKDEKKQAKAKSELVDKSVEAKLDDPKIEKEDVEKYKNDVKDCTSKLADDYDKAKEDALKKVKKQLPKKEYDLATEIQNDLTSHNDKLTNKKDLSKMGLATESIQDMAGFSKKQSAPKMDNKKESQVEAKKEKEADIKSIATLKQEMLKDNENKLKQMKDELLKNQQLEDKRREEENKLLQDALKKQEKPKDPVSNVENTINANVNIINQDMCKADDGLVMGSFSYMLSGVGNIVEQAARSIEDVVDRTTRVVGDTINNTIDGALNNSFTHAVVEATRSMHNAVHFDGSHMQHIRDFINE